MKSATKMCNECFTLENIGDHKCEIVFYGNALKRIIAILTMIVGSARGEDDWGKTYDGIIEDNYWLPITNSCHIVKSFNKEELCVLCSNIAEYLNKNIIVQDGGDKNTRIAIKYINTEKRLLMQIITKDILLDIQPNKEFRCTLEYDNIDKIKEIIDKMNYRIGEVIL